MKDGDLLRVLLISFSYPPVLGGLQTVTHTLARQLLTQGHAVQVVTNRYPRSLPHSEKLDSVSVERLLFLWPELDYLRKHRMDLFLASWFYGPTTLLRLVRLLRSFCPDVVNVHFPDAQTPYVLWLRRRFDFRLVVSLHGDEVLRWGKDEGRTTEDERRRTKDERGLGQLRAVLREADAVTACSGYLLGRAVELEVSIAGKGHVIHNGVDVERFRNSTPYQRARPYIFAYGRFTHKKGFDLLLQAFSQLTADVPPVDLILAGDGEERASLEKQAQHLGLADRVFFYGRAQPQEIVRLLNGSLFVVVPSREEPFGIVALEALAAGKPVLATRVGGLPEILSSLDGRGAALAHPTVGGLAQGLGQWLERRDELSAWGEENQQRAAQFMWERMVEKYLRVYSPGDVL